VSQLVLDHVRAEVERLRKKAAEAYGTDWWEFHIVSRQLRDTVERMIVLERSIEGR
jgi:hypothetical protein